MKHCAYNYSFKAVFVTENTIVNNSDVIPIPARPTVMPILADK